MAENNIKVNWIVNTADVERAKQILAQADQVGNKFQQTAKNAFSGAATDVKRLVAEEQRLESAIKNTSRSAFTSYKAYSQQIQNLSRQYSEVKIKIESATKAINEQNRSIKDNATNVKSLTNGFSGLYNSIRTIIAAGIVRETLNWSLANATLAGNVEGVSRAFAKLPNSVLLLDDLRRATHGTVGDLELMQKALQANNFRIPLEQLGVLLEFASVKAQQTGQEVNHLVDYIVSGIGYRSIKRLDDLGFTANRVKEALGGTTLQAASMGEVMTAVTTLMNEDLQRTGGYAETSATKVGQLQVAWRELRVEVAKKMTTDSGFIDFLNDAVEAMRLFVKGNGDIGKALAVEGIEKEAVSLVKIFQEGLGKDTAKNIEDVQQKLNSTIQLIGRYNDMITETQRKIDLGRGFGFPGFSEENQAGAKRYSELVEQYGNRAKVIFDREISQARSLLYAQIRNREVLESTIPILKQYLDALSDPEQVQSLGLIAEKLEEIEEKSDAIKTAKSRDEIHKLSNELSILQGELADLKAFGTTKQFLEVNGQLKLVPVEEYKIKQYKIQTQNALGELEIKTKPVLGQNPAEATKQLEKEVQEMLDSARFTIPAPVPSSGGITPMSEWEKIGQEFADNWQSVLDQGIGDTTAVIDAAIQKEADAYDARINQARAYYDNLMILAGDNEKEKDRLRIREQREIARLRREAFEADKRAKRSQAVINGAAGVVNAFATLPYPAALVASLLIAAQTAAQIAIINSEQPRFAKGVIGLKGPGSKTSDSIPARLSKGESVMTADETGSSMGILKDIRAGKLNDKLLARKLDEGVLKDLKISKNGVTYVGQDDTRIVNKLDQLINSQPDFEEKNGLLWKTRKKSENYKQWVRAKIM